MPRKKKPEFNVPRMEHSKDLDTYLLGSLKKCYSCPNFMNSKFLVGPEGTGFQVNDTCLAIISPVFREMLFGEGKRSSGKQILTNISPAGFSAIVRHAFSLDPQIDPGNVIEVINACKHFKVYCLHKLAVQYLQDVLRTASEFGDETKYVAVTKFLSMATVYKLPEVVNSCFNALADGGVTEFLLSKAFGEFPAQSVKLVLSFDNLACEEEDIWDAVLNWAKVQSKKNKTQVVDELKKVYHCIRFPLMTSKYFSSNVVPCQVLTQKEMLDVYCYISYPEGKPATNPFSHKRRTIWNNSRVMRFGGKLVQGSEVEHDGSSHCIVMEVDRACSLQAVGTFCGDGLTKATVNVYEATDDDDERKQICTSGEIKISSDKTTEPARLELKEPVELTPEVEYEIEVVQVGPGSFRHKDGLSKSTHEEAGLKVNFTWSKANLETEDTVKKGTIPCVWVNLLSATGTK